MTIAILIGKGTLLRRAGKDPMIPKHKAAEIPLVFHYKKKCQKCNFGNSPASACLGVVCLATIALARTSTTGAWCHLTSLLALNKLLPNWVVSSSLMLSRPRVLFRAVLVLRVLRMGRLMLNILLLGGLLRRGRLLKRVVLKVFHVCPILMSAIIFRTTMFCATLALCCTSAGNIKTG